MTTSLHELRTCVASFLEEHTQGLSIYRNVPKRIDAPAVILRPIDQERLTMRRGFVRTRISLVCCVAMTDTGSEQDDLDDLLTLEGSRSVFAAFDCEEQPLGPDIDVDVSGWSDYDTRTVGDTEYLSASIDLTIISEGPR